MSARDAAIAANRFGLGARPNDLARIGADPKSWLAAQIGARDAFVLEEPGLPTVAEGLAEIRAYLTGSRGRQAQAALATVTQSMAANPEADPIAPIIAPVVAIAQRDFAVRARRALTIDAGFAERLVYFWANHFTVAASKFTTIPMAGVFEREAIRPNLAGGFLDLLLASTRHAGMLLYLDQAQSAGPRSVAGRARDMGLNENLVREILELHTLGVDGGYTQDDVVEFAKALTGWTLATPASRRFLPDAQDGDFIFVEIMHEPGARTVLGKTYPGGGYDQARAILHDLVVHPATAHRVATKLARHFIADEPPQAAIARIERAYRQSGGDLRAVHAAIIDCPEAWAPEPQKFKSPNDFLVSALRMVGLQNVEPRAIGGAFQLLGQPPFQAPSPAGWPDDAAHWANPDALMKRLEWSQAYAERLGAGVRPEAMIEAALGPTVSERTRQAIRAAESGRQGLVLALMSPEFQRR
jgi:uncharacterized protein (DUF1800 family)